jgi:hypothetical protein
MSGSRHQQQSPWQRPIDLDTPNTSPGSSQQCLSMPEMDLSSNQQHSRRPSSTTENQTCSIEPDLTSRRNGMTNFPGLDSAQSSRRSSYSSVTAINVQQITNDSRSRPLDKPMIHIAHDTASRSNDDARLLGRWQCCECRRDHGVYRFEHGQHLISILSCLCPHRSCTSCTLQGRIKRFAPIYDVEGSAVMPVAGDDGQGLYKGIVCRGCGLSWQAEKVEVPKRHKSFR